MSNQISNSSLDIQNTLKELNKKINEIISRYCGLVPKIYSSQVGSAYDYPNIEKQDSQLLVEKIDKMLKINSEFNQNCIAPLSELLQIELEIETAILKAEELALRKKPLVSLLPELSNLNRLRGERSGILTKIWDFLTNNQLINQATKDLETKSIEQIKLLMESIQESIRLDQIILQLEKALEKVS